jgi:hypothetical protein
MQPQCPPPLRRKLLSVLSALALGALPLYAEDVFVVTSLGSASANNTPCPPSCYTGTVSASGSSSYSTATPAPPVSPRRSRFGVADGCSWSVQPDDYVPSTGSSQGTAPLHSPGVYKIYVTKGTTGSCSTDILVNMTATGGALADTNGVAQTTVPVTAFRSGTGANNWVFVGYITNSVPNPVVTFSWVSGTLATSVRWYMDAVRFESLDPCTGVASQLGVTGPLASGQTQVTITGVSAGATNVTVYANGSNQIGSTNRPAGFAAGSLTVNVSGINQSDSITATQTKTNSAGAPCTSQPGTAAIAGGGPNPALKAFISCWKTNGNTGPIGAPGFTAGYPYILSATGLKAGFNTAPVGGRDLPPGACWQLISFQNRTGGDDAIDMNSGSHVTNNDTFCALEGVEFSITGNDTGPYDIYIDALMNGTNVVEDFEGYPLGTTNTFNTPWLATAPVSATTYLTTPNAATISTNYSYTGTNSCRIRWQFADGSNIRWAHSVANADTGKHYPQLDTRLPITLRVLLLPVGDTNAHRFNGSVGAVTNSPATAFPGNSITVGVPVSGAGPYTYQWSENGGAVGGATDRTYVSPGSGSPGSITYSVDVSDGTCVETRSLNVAIATPLPVITNEPVSVLVNVGNPAPISVLAGADASGLPLNYQWEFLGNSWTNTPTAIAATDPSLGTGSGITSAQLSDSGYYDVIIGNSYGSVTSRVVSLQVVGPEVVIGNGTGLRGDYYNDVSYTNTQPPPGVAFPGNPVLTRIDPTVNYIWGNGSPDPSINVDFFAVRWYGQVQPPAADTYTFTARTDDGVRVWVDNTLIIDAWAIQGATDRSGSIALDTSKHTILMEYFERQVSASAQLSWSNASGTIAQSFVPIQQLFPKASYVKPIVTLTSPANGSSTSGAISMSANVTTNDGLIASVAFYTNQSVLATITSPPYTYTWPTPPSGTYGISAQVLYNASVGGGNPSSVAISGTNTVTVISVTPARIGSIVYGNPITITGTGTVGHAFVLLSSTNVAASLATWMPEQTNTAGTGAFTFSVAPGTNASKFFRVLTQ